MARAGSGGRAGGGMRSSGMRSMSRSSGVHRVGSSRPSSSFSSSRPKPSSSSGSSFKPSSSYSKPKPSYGSSFGASTPTYRPPVYRPPIQHTTIVNNYADVEPVVETVSSVSRPPVADTSANKVNTVSSAPVFRPEPIGSSFARNTESLREEKRQEAFNRRVRWIVGVIAILLVMAMVAGILGAAAGNPVSTVNREKLELGIGFNNNCVIDELNWFDNPANAASRLQNFFEKTGVQPYIVLKDYDASLTTDAAKQEYAENWYSENIKNEATFLYMYFAEADVDNEVGAMVYVNGMEIGPVMDAEAVNIFWDYLDSMWYSDMSTDDLFVATFDKTANRIMDKSTTGADIGKFAVIFAGIAVVMGLALAIMCIKRKHEREEAEETARILNAPLNGSSIDALADKYTTD